jgi:enoyl-CoA hydratase/carnithine racemase
MTDLVLARDAGAIRYLTMNRPEKLNAMNDALVAALAAALRTAEADDGVAVIVLAGAGRAFCAGADLKERQGMTDAQWNAQHYVYERMIRAIVECPVPVIAAVHGVAFGGGFQIALGCDFIYASRTARFAQTEVTLGIMPGAGGTQNLPRAVGERRAKEIILTGLPFTAEQAREWGLVNRVCEPAALMEHVMETARRIAANAPIATRQAKHAIHMGMQMDLRSGLMFEIEAYNRLVPTEDRHEGVRAFNEKRRPVFRGK